ncbi:MAG: GspH/FimT family pseudopilin [Desulfamplus sp.]|nr:GspH/FimT family pseudopilin [Desulfamplus sp.]
MNRKPHGFTIIELLTVIGIVSILSAVAVPNLISYRNNAQVRAAARDIHNAFQGTKLEAIKRNLPCVIVFGKDTQGVTHDYLYIVYLDENDPISNKYDPSDNKQILLKKVLFSDYGKVSLDGTPTFPVNGDNLPAVVFRPNGFPYGFAPSSNTNPLSFSLVSGNVSLTGAMKLTVSLSTNGNVRTDY